MSNNITSGVDTTRFRQTWNTLAGTSVTQGDPYKVLENASKSGLFGNQNLLEGLNIPSPPPPVQPALNPIDLLTNLLKTDTERLSRFFSGPSSVPLGSPSNGSEAKAEDWKWAPAPAPETAATPQAESPQAAPQTEAVQNTQEPKQAETPVKTKDELSKHWSQWLTDEEPNVLIEGSGENRNISDKAGATVSLVGGKDNTVTFSGDSGKNTFLIDAGKNNKVTIHNIGGDDQVIFDGKASDWEKDAGDNGDGKITMKNKKTGTVVNVITDHGSDDVANRSIQFKDK